jgi:hypothetical protein
MTGETVRVRQTVGDKAETIRVSREHVADYLRDHPGAMALDDFQAEPMRVAAVKPETERK